MYKKGKNLIRTDKQGKFNRDSLNEKAVRQKIDEILEELLKLIQNEEENIEKMLEIFSSFDCR